MKAIKKLTTLLFAFALVLVLIPITNVQAAITDNKIISKTEVTAKQAEKWAESKGATDTFIGLAKLYWKYAPDHGDVNPAIAYVQAAKETGYGKFGGVLNDSYKNPCGMKTIVGGGDSDPNAHQKFNSWDEGVQSHLDHLALYAGAVGYPKSNTYDPRHFVTIKGKAVTVNALGGKWAPSLTYGEDVNKLYNDLLISAGIATGQKTETNDSKVVDKNSNATNTTKDTETSKEKDSASNTNTNTNTGTSSNTNTNTNTGTSANTNTGTSSSSNANTSANSNTGTSNAGSKPATTQTKTDTIAPKGVQATEPIKIEIDNSTNISSSIGWKSENGNWYYYASNGSKVTGWIKPDSNWYYLYSDGAMAKGWCNSNGTWYYFKSSGAMQTGWLKDSGKWYYLQGDGHMVTGFKLIDGNKYFLDISGAMRTGWFEISGQWYYFNGGGSMLTGWVSDNGWYYLHSNGVMAKGLLNADGNTYYLKSNGSMATGWISEGGNTYYFTPGSGRMAKDTVINGWEIDANGIRGDKIAGSTSTSGKTIVIDPGHNFGGDDGAYSTNSGITYSERELNMQVALKLKSKLEAQGYNVIMTRNESDRETASVGESLAKRVNIANNSGADLFISVHHNSATPAASGVEVYYSSKAQDAAFGSGYNDSKISTSANIASSVSYSIASSTGANNRGAKDGNLFVCRNTTMPAILIECGFISNPDESAKCANSNYQDLEADAIVNAIVSSI